MVESGVPNNLTGFLSSFQSLSVRDQEEALRLLSQQQLKPIPNPVQLSSRSDSEISDPNDKPAHQCSICQKLIVDETQGTCWFSNDALIRGLSRQCTLVQWAFILLRHAVADLKAVLEERAIMFTGTRETGTIGSSADDLRYVDSRKGVRISVAVARDTLKPANEHDNGHLSVYYEPDPRLIDRLWEGTHDPHEYDENYKAFVDKYCASQRASFRISGLPVHTAPSTPNPSTTAATLTTEGGFELARKWLESCQNVHPNEDCRAEPSPLPTRVIDVGTRFPIKFVRLHWPEEGEMERYAALSYCWGGLQTVSSTMQTAQDFTDGVLLSTFPKTLQDAMMTTFKLGLRYIWIDCLCIQQDDPEDIAREIANMAQIYKNAYVTISAARARAANDGFLQHRSAPPETSLRLPFKSADGVMSSISMDQPRQYAPEEDPISLRAWTLQEHILSRRILMYSSLGLWWTCKDVTMNDSDTKVDVLSETRSAQYLFSSSHQTPLDRWRSIVRDYSRRFLTYGDDKFPAIAGVAADYGSTFTGSYLAGLWSFALIPELLWCSKRSDISRPANNRAPSWSWAAVDGEISHDWCPSGYISALDILSCEAMPISRASPYGRIDPRRSLLIIEGCAGRFYWRSTREYIYLPRKRLPGGPLDQDIARTQADAEEPIQLMNTAGKMEVWALVVTKNPTRGLILVDVGGGMFRRVGMFFRFWKDELLPTERRVMTIV